MVARRQYPVCGFFNHDPQRLGPQLEQVKPLHSLCDKRPVVPLFHFRGR